MTIARRAPRPVPLAAVLCILSSSLGCTPTKYDVSTAAGQVACSRASASVRERCSQRYLKEGALTYGVGSFVDRRFDADGNLIAAEVGLPFAMTAHVVGVLVQGRRLNERYLPAFCASEVLSRPPSRSDREEWCFCSAVCKDERAYAKRDCPPTFEHYQDVLRLNYEGFYPFASCSTPPDRPMQPQELVDGFPPGGVRETHP